jgi:hypothetical protein
MEKRTPIARTSCCVTGTYKRLVYFLLLVSGLRSFSPFQHYLLFEFPLYLFLVVLEIILYHNGIVTAKMKFLSSFAGCTLHDNKTNGKK